MQDFSLFFELGWQHILDWRGYDHILFVTVLCSNYLLRDWKQVLILITAFTIGHSLTLALSVLDKMIVSTDWIEFLIPVTIVITALYNILLKRPAKSGVTLAALFALTFGLIHGLGFSNYLKSLMGKSNNVVAELLAFNLGLEFGQIITVICVLILSFLCINLLKVERKTWNLFLSSSIFGIGLVMAIERFPV